MWLWAVSLININTLIKPNVYTWSIPSPEHCMTDPSKPLVETHVDGIFGSIQSPSIAKPTKQPQNSIPTPSTPNVSINFNSIQSTQTLNNNKKKGKDKNQQDNKKPTMSGNDKGKRNEKYPCLLCICDHFMKECPRHEEITQFLKTNPAPAVLTGPFPSQQQLIDHMSNQGNSHDVLEHY